MAKQTEATLLLKIKQTGQEVLDRLVITMGDVMNAVGKLADFMYAGIEAYREQEMAVNELNQSMINSGTFTAELQNQYLDLAAALQKTTLFSDEQINSAQALLQAHIGNKVVSEDLLRATLDLAQAKKMDLASAADLVGKAIGGENEVLKRYGITVKESSNDNEKLANVTEALSHKFGGQAEAARQGMGGIDGFKKSLGEFAEAIGSQVGPAVAKLAESMIPMIDFFTRMTDSGDLAKKSVNQLGHELVACQAELMRLLEARTKVEEGSDHEAWLTTQIKAQTDALAALNEAMQKQIADEQVAKDNAAVKDQERRDADSVKMQEKMLKDREFKLAENEIENQMIQAQIDGNNVKLAELELKHLEMRYKQEKDYRKKVALLDQMEKQQEVVREAKTAAIKEKDKENFYSKMASLQGSSNQVLAAAGKAAAIRQIAIETPVAIMKALSAFPPPFNFAAAGLVGAAAAQQAAQIAGVPLAEGGIVKATPGGIQATIGEGGRDEAVIPLENGQIPGSQQGNVTINVYGGLLGDERSAYELAVAIDKKLYEVRRNGESVAFERLT